MARVNRGAMIDPVYVLKRNIKLYGNSAGGPDINNVAGKGQLVGKSVAVVPGGNLITMPHYMRMFEFTVTMPNAHSNSDPNFIKEMDLSMFIAVFTPGGGQGRSFMYDVSIIGSAYPSSSGTTGKIKSPTAAASTLEMIHGKFESPKALKHFDGMKPTTLLLHMLKYDEKLFWILRQYNDQIILQETQINNELHKVVNECEVKAVVDNMVSRSIQSIRDK
jgi:hypothetical protein